MFADGLPLPATPAGLDVDGACGCAIDKAYAGKSGVTDRAQTAEGQQALAMAVAQCISDRLQGGLLGGASVDPVPADPSAVAPAPAPAEDGAAPSGESQSKGQ